MPQPCSQETFVIECETWQVNVVMATVNLDYVALSSALPACVCVQGEREKKLFNGCRYICLVSSVAIQ